MNEPVKTSPIAAAPLSAVLLSTAPLSTAPRKIPFKVDIAGVIHIMGTALYSRSEAAIRELIQNGHDAVLRRRRGDVSYRGRIEIHQDREAGTLEFRDDGAGINAEEAEKYLGTLGIGITGLLKGEHPSSQAPRGSGDGLIGMFGIGLFSAFMLADRVVVESRPLDGSEPVRWKAGEGSEIELSACDKAEPGTTIRLHLKPEHRRLATELEVLEKFVKEYADFLNVPIFINGSATRANVIHSPLFDPTPDQESIELELASEFEESPLDVVPVQIAKPAVSGALYVTPQRMPGFSGEAVVTATVLRMVVSRDIRGLLPGWASFLRGVLELPSCAPTASREDLVRNREFELVRQSLEAQLFHHFEQLAKKDAARWEAVVAWHRYTLAGAAITEPRLRALLRTTYRFPTSHGQLTFDAILERARAEPVIESDFDCVVWYNTDRRQESYINFLFANHDVPCVHALRSFEESLLAAMVGDVSESRVDLRFATPGSAGFAAQILGVHEMEDAPAVWQEFLVETNAVIRCASFRADQPVMAFLNERHELLRTFDELKKQGAVPSGFQRLIDAHFDEHQGAKNEVLLNRDHPLIARAMAQKTNSPLASVLRLLVSGALTAAGAAASRDIQRQQAEDLGWIGECLAGRL
jgi:molecular chaperone HtpG